MRHLVKRVLGKDAVADPAAEALTLLAAANVGCYLTAFIVGLKFGIAGVAFFYALTGLILHPVSWWLLSGTLHLALGRWLSALLPIIIMVVFFIFSSAMSYGSRVLERRLGLGER